MKIAYIYDAVYPFVKGGVEKRVYEIGKRLAKRHDVYWFGLNWGGELKEIRLYKVGQGFPLYSGNRRSISEAVYFAMKLLSKFKGEYDIIDCQQFPYLSCFSAKFHSTLKNTPLVITWHEVWEEYWKEYLGSLGVFGAQIEKLTGRLTRNHVSVSKLTQRRLHSLGVRSDFIPNGIDFDSIDKVKKADDRYDVIFVGRLIKEKNVNLLLKALMKVKESIPDITAVIIGDGPEKSQLKKLALELGLSKNVTFMEFRESHDEILSYMKSSKVFVLPSKREGFGIVALEANASGLLVITLDYPMNATKELIIHGYNGFISQSSPNSLAKYIEISLFSGKKLKRNCIKNAKKYDWDNIAELTEKFYERVSNEH